MQLYSSRIFIGGYFPAGAILNTVPLLVSTKISHLRFKLFRIFRRNKVEKPLVANRRFNPFNPIFLFRILWNLLSTALLI